MYLFVFLRFLFWMEDMDVNPNRHIEVCFSPAVYSRFHDNEAVVVVVDILRATSTICTAFKNGAKQVIPVSTSTEAYEYKQKGYLVAGERDGEVLDFADFGNSPFNFTAERVGGKSVVFSTTNGTSSIRLASNSYNVIIGSFLNIDAVADALKQMQRNVVILCAGWKDKFSLEDSLFAGALSSMLLKNGGFTTECDSAYAAMDLWSVAKVNVLEYIEKAAQRHRLKKRGLDDVLAYCFTIGQTDIVPVLRNNVLEACRFSVSSSLLSRCSAGLPA